MGKIIDCTMFFNELEVLELRLEELYDTVDKFIIVEANLTHTGIPKEFVFENNTHRYKKYLDKIVYEKVYDMPTATKDDLWCAFEHQRNATSRALDKIAMPGDYVLLSDLDEIPKPAIIRERYGNPEWVVFKMLLYYYWVNCKVKRNWGGTAMVPYGSFQTLHQVRRMAIRHSFGTYPPSDPIAGWHYSYLYGGDVSKMLNKWDAVVDKLGETLDVGGYADVEQKVREKRDLYGRDELPNKRYMKMQIVDIEETKPASMDWFLAKYPHLFYRG